MRIAQWILLTIIMAALIFGAVQGIQLNKGLSQLERRADKRHQQESYGKDSFSKRMGVWVGTEIKPSPDYALIAQASHAYGKMVREPSELRPALRQALDQVHQGKPAVLDVRIEEI